MSSVIAGVVEIEAVHPHPNADRLFLARIKGWQAVIRKLEDGCACVASPLSGFWCGPTIPAGLLNDKLTAADTRPLSGAPFRSRIQQSRLPFPAPGGVIGGVRGQDLFHRLPRPQVLERPWMAEQAGEGVAALSPFES